MILSNNDESHTQFVQEQEFFTVYNQTTCNNQEKH